MIEVNSLWIGNKLTDMERMCICSHLRNGHSFHLYTYNDISNVPDGVIIKNAREVLPESEIFAYTAGEGKGSYSAFSNFFRYKLLLDRGGWWVDMDVCCLKPFDLTADHVFASERMKGGGILTTTCAIKSPARSSVMQYCWAKCCITDKQEVRWGEIGPLLLTTAVKACGVTDNVMEPDTFCPIDWYKTDMFMENIQPPKSYAVHLWNEMWRRTNKDKESRDGNTLYGRLKDLYLPQTKKIHVFMM